MRHFFTILNLLWFISAINCDGQVTFDSVRYKRILYRINTGGISMAPHDNTTIRWAADNYTHPSVYSNFSSTGNKVFETTDTITLHSSVPQGTPVNLFKDERSVDSNEVAKMEWDFPADAGKLYEVRLYFCEIYFTTPGTRIFDIVIDENISEDNLDLASSYGYNTAVLKTSELRSDGNIDIDLIREKNNPSVSAIEILEINETTATGIYNNHTVSGTLSSPNPFSDFIKIDTDFTMYNMSGFKIRSSENTDKTDGSYLINTESLMPGIYLIRTGSYSEKVMKK
jgi:hypothetical protein